MVISIKSLFLAAKSLAKSVAKSLLALSRQCRRLPAFIQSWLGFFRLPAFLKKKRPVIVSEHLCLCRRLPNNFESLGIKCFSDSHIRLSLNNFLQTGFYRFLGSASCTIQRSLCTTGFLYGGAPRNCNNDWRQIVASAAATCMV